MYVLMYCIYKKQKQKTLPTIFNLSETDVNSGTILKNSVQEIIQQTDLNC